MTIAGGDVQRTAHWTSVCASESGCATDVTRPITNITRVTQGDTGHRQNLGHHS